MHERTLPEIVINQHRHRSQRPQRKPQPNELRLIHEIHRDQLLLLHPMALLQPRRPLQHRVVSFRVRPFCALVRLLRVGGKEKEEFRRGRGVLGVGFEDVEDVDAVLFLELFHVEVVGDCVGEGGDILGEAVFGVDVGEEGGGRGGEEGGRESWEGVRMVAVVMVFCGRFGRSPWGNVPARPGIVVAGDSQADGVWELYRYRSRNNNATITILRIEI